jgi:hypothetical protein
MHMNVNYLDFLLRAAGIPIDGVSGNGTPWYDASATAAQITQGNSIVANYLANSALIDAQTDQVAVLQAAYAAAINAPISFKNAAGVTSTYPSGNTVAINGQTAKQNLEDCIAAGASAWSLGCWLDTNNVAQTFTFADLQGLAAAMEAVVTTDWKDLVAKISAVQAATTISAVQAVTF